jgi:hypothetical protein
MVNLEDREAGFYWISINGEAAEVAKWQTEWGAWLLVGRMLPLTDELGSEVEVLGPCLVPPPQPARKDSLF